MPRRFKIVLQYDGTNYCGWQRQLKDRSIQAEIEEALKPLNRNQPVAVIGAGRTDSGVHARRQTAHFDLITDLPALSV
ncbi:MAG: tRNA pseudouridine(38-40) synthase TruA, partial [Candidatus Neomarinimicrobiota bacterium]